MSNPFGDSDDNKDNEEILEGFLCPICREDLKSVEFLTEHFERAHKEQEDVLKSLFKDIFNKAKKKINLHFDDNSDISRTFEKQCTITSNLNNETGSVFTSNARTHMNVYNFMVHQEIGVDRSHMQYFQSIRSPRLERYAIETNKLIIRLHKLLKDMPTDTIQRKQHEQKIVSWLDGNSVKLCPNCAKSFHIARRQHHCRLCGSIMCKDCSKFLSVVTAMKVASIKNTTSDNGKNEVTGATSLEFQPDIRCCEHCLRLLETRQEMYESRTYRPVVVDIYQEIQQLRKNVVPDIEMYLKIVNSLYEGDSIFTLSDASALRGKIGKIAETIDMLSKRVIAIPCQDGTREESLKNAIRLSCVHLIKEKMLSLPPLPKDEDIRQIQERKRMEAEQRIAMERRLAMEAYEKYEMDISTNDTQNKTIENYAQGSDLHSLNNWSAHQTSLTARISTDDPLIEQINIIKNYIKQARQDMNFEVVETLEINLRELQKEFYERQKLINNIKDKN